MAEPSMQQVWLIQKLLKPYGNTPSHKTVLDLVSNDRSRASIAIERLKRLNSLEADRINALPVEERLKAKKNITEEEFRWAFS